jgi:hypothetical protein
MEMEIMNALEILNDEAYLTAHAVETADKPTAQTPELRP